MAIPTSDEVPVAGLPPARLFVRLAAMVYEGFLLVALLAAVTAIFVAAAGDARHGIARHMLQFVLLIVAAAYFTWSWSSNRRTLAMKTWRLHLVDMQGHPLDARQALIRFALAALGVAACGATIFWAFADPQRQFLHDRLAGTRLVRSPPAVSSGAD